MLRMMRATALLFLVTAPLLAQEAPVPVAPPGDVSVQELIERWANETGASVVVDPQAAQIRLHFASETRLDREVLRSILSFHDVVLLEEEGKRFQVHHRRNMAQRVPIATPVTSGSEAPPPEGDRMVTWVHYVRHGAANSIFASLRALLVRDMNRVGNIVYVPGPEALVFVDLAPQLTYYREVVERLDVAPPVTTTALRLYELPRAKWVETARGRGGATLAKALAAVPEAVLLESAELDLVSDPLSLGRDLSREDGSAVQVRLRVGAIATAETGQPIQPMPGQRMSLTLSVSVRPAAGGESLLRTLDLSLPALVGGEETLVSSFVGREGKDPTQLVLVLATQPRAE